MNISPGNYYRTRNGQQVLCIGKLRHNCCNKAFVFECLHDKEFNWNLITTDVHGRYLGCEDKSGFDIVFAGEKSEEIESVRVIESPTVIACKVNELVHEINKLKEKMK
jgi:hypothetical protein